MDRRKFLAGAVATPVVCLSEKQDDAPHTAEELEAKIEEMYPCFDGPLGPRTLTGEVYTVVSGDRVKVEGLESEGFETVEGSIKAAWFAFLGHTT